MQGQTVFDILSSEFIEELDMLKEIPANTTIEFKLLSTGSIDKRTGKPATMKRYSPSARIDILDPGDRKRKIIQNIESFEPVQVVGHGMIFQPVIKMPEFKDGVCSCGPGDENLYWYLKAHPKNATNPRHGKVTKFYEVSEKKETMLKVNLYDYKAMAVTIMASIEDDDKLVAIANKMEKTFPGQFAFSDKTDSDKLRLALQGVADSSPREFLIAVKEPKSYARILVDNAISRNQVFFEDHENNLNWKFKKSRGEKGKVLIMKVNKEKTKMKELVEFLTSDKGNEHLVELKRLDEVTTVG